MNEVLQTVLDYVKSPQTDYALLITGPWGCGKTYFWKNVIKPKLESLKYDRGSFRALYASLYGCHSTTEVDVQLFLASYPKLRKKWIRRFSTVGGYTLKQVAKKFTGLELPVINLRWLVKTKHAVLCFDDLERTNLPMKELLGYINTFVEHEGAKVIILCNEDGISDEEDRKIYDEMKEKVIGASLPFRPDLETVFSTLIDKYKPQKAFHDFISNNIKLIRHLFKRSEIHNIRTLRCALSSTYTVFDAIRKGDVDPNKMAKQLIYAVAPSAFELYGHGADPEKLRKIHGMAYMPLSGISPSDRNRNTSNEKAFEEQFSERYFHNFGMLDWRNAPGCPPICEFLLTGFLDRKALLGWARELTRPPDEKEERIKRLLHDPREMENGEFEQVASQVLNEVEAGEIADFGIYLRLYDRFEWFVDEGLVSMTRQQVLDNFIGGLEKAQKADRLKPNPRLKLDIEHLGLASKTEEGRTLRQHVLEANEESLGRGVSEHIKDLASRFQEDASGFIDVLMDSGESGFLLTPVFHELDADDTAACILALPNSLKSHFGMALHARYRYGNRALPPEFAIELPVLTKIRDVMKRICKESSKDKETVPMSLFITQDIVLELDGAVERLQQLKQQEEGPASEPIEDQPPDESSPDMTDEGDEDQQGNEVRSKPQ